MKEAPLINARHPIEQAHIFAWPQKSLGFGMTIFSTQKQDGFWHGSVVFVDEEKKRLIESGKDTFGKWS